VVVSGHIPELLGTWGLSTIGLGKSVNQERQAKGRKFVWVGTTVLRQEFFVHEEKGRARNRAWSRCSHGEKILEQARTYLEHFGVEDCVKFFGMLV
jgi:hypothetical protein